MTDDFKELRAQGLRPYRVWIREWKEVYTISWAKDKVDAEGRVLRCRGGLAVQPGEGPEHSGQKIVRVEEEE